MWPPKLSPILSSSCPKIVLKLSQSSPNESSWQHPYHNLVDLLILFWWICFTAITNHFPLSTLSVGVDQLGLLLLLPGHVQVELSCQISRRLQWNISSLFSFCFYSDAEKMTEKAEKSRLKTRLQFHLSHKWVIIITEKPDCNLTKLGNIWLRKNLKSAIFCRFGDEKKLMQFHQELEDVIEDQLSLGRK